MTNNNEQKKITITLTRHRPVRINPEEWPIIASASDDDAREPGDKPNRVWKLKVRQHADGRAIVYGTYRTEFLGDSSRDGGKIVPPGADIVAAIYEVAEDMDFPRTLAEACVADLPPEDL